MMRLIILCLASYFFSSSAALATPVEEFTTPGGLSVWIVREPSLPLWTMKISFAGAGAAYDAKGKEGRATMLASLLMEGAGEMDSAAFNSALESHAIRMNMFVDADMFHISLSSLSEHSEEALRLLGLALTQPRFDDEALARSQRQALSIIKQQQQEPRFLVSKAWVKTAFGDHPYHRMQLENPDSIQALDTDDIKEAKERYLARDNMLITVVGDVDKAQFGAMLDKALGALPEKRSADVSLSRATLGSSPKPQVIDFDIPQTIVMFGAEALRRDDPDYIPAFIMNEILGGGGLTSQLNIELREKRGLTYGINSGLVPQIHAGSWRGQFSTRNEQAGEALGVLKAQLAEFAQHGPTDAQLADAKRYLTGSFALNLDSNADMADFLMVMRIHALGRDYIERRNALIHAVTKEQVHAVAKRILQGDKLIITIIGKPVFEEK